MGAGAVLEYVGDAERKDRQGQRGCWTRRQAGTGRQGTVRGLRQGLGPGEEESWVQGRTKPGQNVKEDGQWGQRKALGKISLTLMKNVTFFFSVKAFSFQLKLFCFCSSLLSPFFPAWYLTLYWQILFSIC